MLTKIQIIDETVEFYSNNPRSVHSSVCLYNGPSGEKCAFSRCCTDDTIFQEGQPANEQSEAKLLPQYSYIPFDHTFWIDLQGLHDLSYHWDGRELSTSGLTFVNNLKEKYKH